MSDPKRPGSQEVTFVLYDQTTVVKMVTKTTTCDDVINTLPRQSERLSVFESVGGVDKELPGKTRILKVWRTQGANSDVQFVIRKSVKLGRHKLIISKVKAKLDAFSRRLSMPRNKNNRINHIVPPTSTRVVMDRSLANPDVENVAALSSGGGVTCGQLPMTSTPRRATIATTTRSRINSGRGGRIEGKQNIRRRTIVECDYDEYPLHSTTVVALTSTPRRTTIAATTRSRINRQAVGDSLTTMKLAFLKAANPTATVRGGRGGWVDEKKNIRRRTIDECEYD